VRRGKSNKRKEGEKRGVGEKRGGGRRKHTRSTGCLAKGGVWASEHTGGSMKRLQELEKSAMNRLANRSRLGRGGS